MPEIPCKKVFSVKVGPASFAVREGRATSAVNQPDTVSGIVPADDMARSPVDWAGPAQAAVGDFVLMSGEVVEARPESDGSVAVSLRSGVMLDENLVPPMVAQNLTPQEIVYAAARSAGFAVDKIHIHGLNDLPVEPMWVLAPVDGVRVEGTVRVGVVEFVDAVAGQAMLRRFSPPLDPAFTDPLEGASFARVAVVAGLPYEAEQEGLTLIDTAVAWLTTRLRYSWSHLPDGTLQHYERASTRVAVARRDGVGVLAVDGPRRWWRSSTTVGRASGEVTLAAAHRWTEPALSEVAPGDRQALFALQRAVTASDPVQRVVALWEAIEFYVGKRTPSRRSPITVRLKYVFDEEGVPVTNDDLALLRRLRDERNLAVHGSAAAPEHEEIDRGIAVMSRALTTRVHRGRG